MAYNTKAIITDIDGNPISQYYNPDTDKYEPTLGGAGANKVILYNADGSINNSLSLIPILDKLSQLTGTVIDESTRKANEISRNNNEEDRKSNEDIRNRNEIERVESEDRRTLSEGIRESNEDIRLQNEINRVNLYQDLLDKLVSGYFNGKNLEFHWRGTELGVRVEDVLDYVYVDLKGDTGDIENLTSTHVTDALGYTPVSPSEIPTSLPANGGNADTVNGFTVETNVPANANFANTTYTEITTAEIDAGTSSTLRVITGRRVKYILDKISTIISSAITALTKADVGLSNVDNVKQMPISNGVLEDYREKLVTLSGTSTAINLSLGNVFRHTLSGATTYTISNAVASQSHSFTLIINQPSTTHSVSFPASVKWMNEQIPDLSTVNKTYYLTFDTIDGGTTWHGRFGGMF